MQCPFRPAWIVLVLLLHQVSAISLHKELAHPNTAQNFSHLRENKTNELHLPGAHLQGERRADIESWQTGKPQSFAGVLPPKCPTDVSPESPYMQEHVEPDEVHTICQYRQPCDRKGPNLERVESIRGLLARTKQLMNHIGIPYAIYGGSAIGQHRCRDVLPWDSDCDVIVWMQDAHKISPGDLDGINGKYAVMHTQGNSAIPFVVADKMTGFYCDVFFMNYLPDTGLVNLAWPWGKYTCYDMSTDYPFNSEIKRCDKIPVNNVYPFVPCVLNGIQHTCFQDQPAYLESQYGYDWEHPNVSTQPGGGKKTNLRAR